MHLAGEEGQAGGGILGGGNCHAASARVHCKNVAAGTRNGQKRGILARRLQRRLCLGCVLRHL